MPSVVARVRIPLTNILIVVISDHVFVIIIINIVMIIFVFFPF